jgi:hypothetical protein
VDARVVGDLGRGAVVHHDHVPDRVERAGQLPERAEQRAVDEHHVVLGVVDDERQLLREQPDVQRVQDPAGARGGPVEREVVGGVPGERADPGVGGHVERVQHATDPAGAVGPLRDRGAHAAGDGAPDQFLVAVQPLEPVEDGGQGERVVLHQTSHGGLLAVVGPSL